jgi:hypothetical protein
MLFKWSDGGAEYPLAFLLLRGDHVLGSELSSIFCQRFERNGSIEQGRLFCYEKAGKTEMVRGMEVVRDNGRQRLANDLFRLPSKDRLKACVHIGNRAVTIRDYHGDPGLGSQFAHRHILLYILH